MDQASGDAGEGPAVVARKGGGEEGRRGGGGERMEEVGGWRRCTHVRRSSNRTLPPAPISNLW
jgi:hypothetical protein